jgi:uncharacterized protein (UPF0147 family)
MFEVIKLLGGAGNIISKVGLLLVIVALCLFIDYFTSFPSLSFDQNRYQTIEKMNGICKDVSIPADVRSAARARMLELSRRKSFREITIEFRSESLSALYNISHIVTSVKLIL